MKSPVGSHQNLLELICQCPTPASQLPGWLPVTLGERFPPSGAPKVSTHTPSLGRGELRGTWLPWPGEGLRSRLGWLGGSLRRGVKVISQIKACCGKEGMVETPNVCGDGARLSARVPRAAAPRALCKHRRTVARSHQHPRQPGAEKGVQPLRCSTAAVWQSLRDQPGHRLTPPIRAVAATRPQPEQPQNNSVLGGRAAGVLQHLPRDGADEKVLWGSSRWLGPAPLPAWLPVTLGWAENARERGQGTGTHRGSPLVLSLIRKALPGEEETRRDEASALARVRFLGRVDWIERPLVRAAVQTPKPRVCFWHLAFLGPSKDHDDQGAGQSDLL